MRKKTYRLPIDTIINTVIENKIKKSSFLNLKQIFFKDFIGEVSKAN